MFDVVTLLYDARHKKNWSIAVIGKNCSRLLSYKSCRFDSPNGIHYGKTKTDITEFISSNCYWLDTWPGSMDLVQSDQLSDWTGEQFGIQAQSGCSDGNQLLWKVLSLSDRSFSQSIFNPMYACRLPDRDEYGSRTSMQLSRFAIWRRNGKTTERTCYKTLARNWMPVW